MTFEQMKENLNTIGLLERDLLRDLTTEEKEVVIKEGWESFLFGADHLNFNEEDFRDLRAIKEIVSAFYTQDENIFEQLVANCPVGAYCALKEIVNSIEEADKAKKKTAVCASPCTKEPAKKQDPEVTNFAQFIQDLYNSLKEPDKKWFNKLNDNIRKDLFNTFEKEKDTCTENELCGVMTDAVKDSVVEDYVARLKKGEAIDMTNDEYMEVADFLCEHEDHIFLSNENGKVRLAIL